jgi:hypothetical protein
MEIDLGSLLRSGALRSAGLGFVLSLVVAFGIASLLGVAGLIQAPLLVAIMLSATSVDTGPAQFLNPPGDGDRGFHLGSPRTRSIGSGNVAGHY